MAWGLCAGARAARVLRRVRAGEPGDRADLWGVLIGHIQPWAGGFTRPVVEVRRAPPSY